MRKCPQRNKKTENQRKKDERVSDPLDVKLRVDLKLRLPLS